MHKVCVLGPTALGCCGASVGMETQHDIALKRPNIESPKQCHMIAYYSSFLAPKISAKIVLGHPKAG